MNPFFLFGFLGASIFLEATALGKITVERKNIVDNGGYLIRNVAFSTINGTDLVLTANPSDNDLFGNVTLSKNEGLKKQKWGVAYYGGATASLSPGENRNNDLTLYHTESGLVNPFHERQYTFANCYWNEEFKIRNEENKLCLSIKEWDAVIDFAPCEVSGNSEGNIFWTFERYG